MAAFKFRGLAPSALLPAPIPAPRVLHPGKATERLVTQHMRLAAAADTVVDAVIDAQQPPTTRPALKFKSLKPKTQSIPPEQMTDDQLAEELGIGDIPQNDDALARAMVEQQGLKARSKGLSKLVDENFPFDDSQRAAINGLAGQKYACMTGAAGTGKTTCTKALIDKLMDDGSLGEVDMTTYFKQGVPANDGDDDYEVTEQFVPSICAVSFTGQASQMIKKNFPRDWHGNIMTIHRMLAFCPEFYEDWNAETGQMVNKMRFVPTYGKWLKMPWDIVVIDEAGMVSVDLWQMVWDALKPGARVIMIGDINQLPPVHGRSIFGFAMTQWPSWELTTIHRQKGVNNSIVDNAWRILQGKTPVSDAPSDLKLNLLDKEGIVRTLNWMVTNKDWKTLTLMIPDDAAKASRHIRMMVNKLQGHFYDPIRDVIITAINGHDGSQGRALGQIPLNQELALSLNHDGQRYIIDAGRERKNFGIGEKVMNTKNDHEAGVTNGMTGIITKIVRNAAYSGDTQRFDTVENVNAYLSEMGEEHEEDFSLEMVSESVEAIQAGKDAGKEKKDRGPASHIVTVRFGQGEHSFELFFATLAEVASLQTAYAVTCHKMQGSESPHIFTICSHAVAQQMMTREWLYTSWTRASQKTILLYTPFGLRKCLNKQTIKGTTLREKVASFQKIQDNNKGNSKYYLPAAEAA